MSVQSITITILDKKINVACPKSDEVALHAAAEELNSRLAKFKAGNNTLSAEQALLITALNLINELQQTKLMVEKIERETQSKIELLQTTIGKALIAQQQAQESAQ